MICLLPDGEKCELFVSDDGTSGLNFLDNDTSDFVFDCMCVQQVVRHGRREWRERREESERGVRDW